MVTRDNTPQVLAALRNNFPTGTSFSILAVTPDGKISIHASDVLKPYSEKWYDEEVRKDAIAAVATLPARKRSHISISLPLSKSASAKNAAAAAAAAAVSQTVSPPPEDDELPNLSEIAGDKGSASPMSTIRPRKKQRRTSSIPQDPSTGVPIKKSRNRKNSLNSASTPGAKIKQEAEATDGPQMETEWVNVENTPVGDEDPNENNDEEEESDEEEIELEPLRIGDEEALNQYILNKFLQIQQLDCKTIAKCWIKVLEPKKQAHSPYNGGEATKPWWWPPGAPHKEPDHLLKEDRIEVLMNIIRNGVAPVYQLRASTDDAPLRASKKEILAEMYDVIELELRLKEGNLDRDHIRYVKPFVKGNKRRKKREPKTQGPKATTPKSRKQSTVKAETGESSLGSILETESSLSDFFKKEDGQDTEDGILVQPYDFQPADNNLACRGAGNSQTINSRRQSAGIIGAANPNDAPLSGFQHRSNSVPSVQHTSGRFSKDRYGSVSSHGGQIIHPTANSSPNMTDGPVFDWTPSPTSTYGSQLQSPGQNIGLLATTQSGPAPNNTGMYHTMFENVNMYQIPSPGDVTMMNTNDSELYTSPVMNTPIYQPNVFGDAYSGFALDDDHSLRLQNYPPQPQYYSGDVNMGDSTQIVQFP